MLLSLLPQALKKDFLVPTLIVQAQSFGVRSAFITEALIVYRSP